MTQRILSVDIAKGIVIISVILAHTFPSTERGDIRELIYSFHMPLFFILSGYTSKYSLNFKEVYFRGIHTIKKLGMPLISLWLVFTAHACLTNIESYPSLGNFAFHKSLQLLYASGVTNSQLVILGGGNIEALGIPWFFAALMGSKILYDCLQVYFKSYRLFIVVFILSLCGITFGRFYHLPLSLDISFAVLLFLWMGQKLKSKSIAFELPIFLSAILCWGISWIVIKHYGDWGLEIAGRSYPLFPLCYIGAFAATIVILHVSDFISKKDSQIKSQLVLWGTCSMNILIIHCLDFLWEDIYMISETVWINVSLRIIVDLTIFYAYRILKFRYFNKWKIKPVETLLLGKKWENY